VEVACQVGDAVIHEVDLALELAFLALEVVSLDVDDAAQATDQADERIELTGRMLDVLAGRADPLAELADALLQTADPLGQQVARLCTFAHWKRALPAAMLACTSHLERGKGTFVNLGKSLIPRLSRAELTRPSISAGLNFSRD